MIPITILFFIRDTTLPAEKKIGFAMPMMRQSATSAISTKNSLVFTAFFIMRQHLLHSWLPPEYSPDGILPSRSY